jgi:hypothetical protein
MHSDLEIPGENKPKLEAQSCRVSQMISWWYIYCHANDPCLELNGNMTQLDFVDFQCPGTSRTGWSAIPWRNFEENSPNLLFGLHTGDLFEKIYDSYFSMLLLCFVLGILSWMLHLGNGRCFNNTRIKEIILLACNVLLLIACCVLFSAGQSISLQGNYNGNFIL